ncbi:fungal-specific transcription factor domain-containing protein [Lophiotrema nucula]|uniref:Fungal-specific transcription factor domain-containing protein n=1 Tax=Lophiotrema nucula TaxID=690887 RepID=A0A6A5Z053_9PLEO|nr:fungal-specific transcription factor domain-containing protein [Lophiotrema nucula]
MSAVWSNFSVSANGENEGPQSIGEELPACASCRKRKLRCSRESPSCSQCERLAILCVYSPKQKPGLKTGALEALTRRVAFLEGVLLNEIGDIRSQFKAEGENQAYPGNDDEQPITIQNHQSQDARDTVASPNREVYNCTGNAHNAPPKRKRTHPTSLASLVEMDLEQIGDYLPGQSLLLTLVDYFCVTFHHWIPMVHKKRLQTTVRNGSLSINLCLLMHSLVAATMRHMDRAVLFLDEDQVAYQTNVSRFIVERFAVREVSLESLRSLVILVFDYLNDGNAKKAWPLIGSLTRTVDYLQLTLEPSVTHSAALMSPLRLVRPTSDWTELEERRRLFWVVFLLDRFCSVSTGWNFSLTSEDVHRRLPADGGYFTREEPVTTPFFGIWNKAAARIGRSLANVPAQYNEEDPAVDQTQSTSPGSANGLIDASKLGAFAYCIEATESLSQVTTFFLQQRINWQDKEHAISWLTRFKELDLRLVQWKLFLPPRWKDSDISPDTQIVDMDPNLTLAHITHNTSMILLHHPIAYPPKEWNNYIALPKTCSVQTCEHAAIETSNIVSKFLAHRVVFVNVQFAFCTFVAAKTLLYGHQAKRRPLRPEFGTLVQSLHEMSARWTSFANRDMDSVPGPDIDIPASDQAAVYARHLQYLRSRCDRSPPFTFDLYDHSCLEQDVEEASYTARQTESSDSPVSDVYSNASRHGQRQPNQRGRVPSPADINTPALPGIDHVTNLASPNSPHSQHPYPSPGSMHFPGTFGVPHSTGYGQNSLPQQPQYTSTPAYLTDRGLVTAVDGNTVQDQSLLSLSDTFMDSQFLGLDRVITFDDANFFLPGDGFRWQ